MGIPLGCAIILLLICVDDIGGPTVGQFASAVFLQGQLSAEISNQHWALHGHEDLRCPSPRVHIIFVVTVSALWCHVMTHHAGSRADLATAAPGNGALLPAPAGIAEALVPAGDADMAAAAAEPVDGLVDASEPANPSDRYNHLAHILCLTCLQSTYE